MNDHSEKTSAFRALRNPLYRKLWFAILLSGTCVAAHDTAATWTMNMLGSSTFLLSLISTVASLPFFLFTLPAGALADMVNRRKLLCFMNLWLAVAAGLLAILASFHLVKVHGNITVPERCELHAGSQLIGDLKAVRVALGGRCDLPGDGLPRRVRWISCASPSANKR
jgi:MFS family permease